MRVLTISDCVCGPVFSSGVSRPKWGYSRLWVWILAATAAVSVGMTGTAAKAGPPPSDLSLVSSVAEALVYLSAVPDKDPVEAEQMRQLLLWVLWRLGGNPWDLDPNWIPPTSGTP